MGLAGDFGPASIRETLSPMKALLSWTRLVLLAVLAGAAIAVAAKDATTGSGMPAKPGAAPAADKEEPKIAGFAIPRDKGGYLGLEIVNGNFKLSFYNDKKQPVAVDVTRATARWIVHYSVYDERAVLNPSPDGMSLTSGKFVRPPYQFKLYLTLITEGSDQPPEAHTIDFKL